MRILVACETSGKVRDAFRALGHDAWSCDLLESTSDNDSCHFQCDVKEIIDYWQWDLMVAHPPCTYLSASGLHWNGRTPGRSEKTEQALEFVRWCMNAPVPLIAIENPKGCISTRIREPDQIIQPYDFGHDASKETHLWLKGLPLLRPTRRFIGRMVPWPVGTNRMVERWSNQTDSGQNRLPPTADRWQLRSETYEGIANAMAEQWGSPENYKINYSFDF